MKDHYVTLDDPIEDGTPVVFSPDHVWAEIEPLAPGAFDEEKAAYNVTIWFHPQVTYNTRIQFTYRDRPHQLFVRGIQNIKMQGKELLLFCEEVLTP